MHVLKKQTCALTHMDRCMFTIFYIFPLYSISWNIMWAGSGPQIISDERVCVYKQQILQKFEFSHSRIETGVQLISLDETFLNRTDFLQI